MDEFSHVAEPPENDENLSQGLVNVTMCDTCNRELSKSGGCEDCRLDALELTLQIDSFPSSSFSHRPKSLEFMLRHIEFIWRHRL